MGILKNVFGKKEEKTDDDLKAAVLKKATENWNAKSESSFIDEDVIVKSDPADIEESKKQNIQTVLLELVEGGETGVLATSISDKTGLTNVNTTTALSYLIENKYAEAINSTTGVKYYITEAGRTRK